VTFAGDAMRGALAFLLLPLSLVPLYFAVPKIRGGEDAVGPDRAALDAPPLTPTQAQLAKWEPLPPIHGGVPVLAYHGVNERSDHYSVTPHAFAEQMAMLKRAGFESVTVAEYVRFLQGTTDNLPPRPILITFDDGRLDSYRGADRILAKYGFKATMFVIAGFVENSNSFYLTWDELRRMAASRRWDLQEHAGAGHVNVRYDAAGHQGPAYAFRQYQPGRGLESFDAYKQRVEHDVLWAKRTMSEQLSGFSPLTFAVPFGSYGQDRTNDPRIPRFMSRLLRRHFQAVFLTDPPEYTTPSTSRAALGRIELHEDTGTDRLYRWLRDRAPSRRAASGGPVTRPAVERAHPSMHSMPGCPAWGASAAGPASG
jgi:peptidoglycan/xylan/chitin deacetylase (PgdA/CDA1 family)